MNKEMLLVTNSRDVALNQGCGSGSGFLDMVGFGSESGFLDMVGFGSESGFQDMVGSGSGFQNKGISGYILGFQDKDVSVSGSVSNFQIRADPDPYSVFKIWSIRIRFSRYGRIRIRIRLSK